MWEMINVSDVVASEDFPISQGRLSMYNLPIFILLNARGSGNDGTTPDGKQYGEVESASKKKLILSLHVLQTEPMVLSYTNMMKRRKDSQQKPQIKENYQVLNCYGNGNVRHKASWY